MCECVCVCMCVCVRVHACVCARICACLYVDTHDSVVSVSCVFYCALCKISMLITDLIIIINIIVPLFRFLCTSIFTFITYFSLNTLYIL